MEIDRIHLLSISTPFPVGRVNVYLCEGDIPTLIDAPPRGSVYIDELEAALKGKGYSIKDIKRVIITHPHFDHFGAAAEIVRVSKAAVWVSQGISSISMTSSQKISSITRRWCANLVRLGIHALISNGYTTGHTRTAVPSLFLASLAFRFFQDT